MGQYLKAIPKMAVRGRQRGVVLFIALIALISMTLAGIALMRSVDTANLIAGNFAFKEAAMHASDSGVEAALASITAPVTGWAAKGNVPVANQYFPAMQILDLQGVPTGVNWTLAATPLVPPPGYDVRYVVERMCDKSVGPNGPLPGNTTQISSSCITVPTASGSGGSKKSGSVVLAGSGVVYYRVTVRVTGPHGAVSMVQGTIIF